MARPPRPDRSSRRLLSRRALHISDLFISVLYGTVKPGVMQFGKQPAVARAGRDAELLQVVAGEGNFDFPQMGQKEGDVFPRRLLLRLCHHQENGLDLHGLQEPVDRARPEVRLLVKNVEDVAVLNSRLAQTL